MTTLPNWSRRVRGLASGSSLEMIQWVRDAGAQLNSEQYISKFSGKSPNSLVTGAPGDICVNVSLTSGSPGDLWTQQASTVSRSGWTRLVSSSAGGSGAAVGSAFLIVGKDAALTSARSVAAGTGITFADGGAASILTINATVSSTTSTTITSRLSATVGSSNITLDLPGVGTAGSYAFVTTDAYGRVTAGSTSLSTTSLSGSITTGMIVGSWTTNSIVGSWTTNAIVGSWTTNAIVGSWTTNSIVGTWPVGDGGTGLTSYNAGDMLYAATTTTLSTVTQPAETLNNVLVSNQGKPFWKVQQECHTNASNQGGFSNVTTNINGCFFNIGTANESWGFMFIVPLRTTAGTAGVGFALSVPAGTTGAMVASGNTNSVNNTTTVYISNITAQPAKTFCTAATTDMLVRVEGRITTSTTTGVVRLVGITGGSTTTCQINNGSFSYCMQDY